ncbi:queuosine precursor transporter [Halosolutus amylolyticus]|uniref:Probable queuosine precursor transporter n=1 Tax=Halosolutus amylolyticus TaxID=2932267 RepID=A0ABD5PL64_9EURY|nr:queuosine precursor transporter [Halosolutus amylolyticus]
MTQHRGAPTIAQVALIGLFVAALVTAQLTASKVLAFDIPVALPITGAQLALPGAALAYALTFLASDCYTELYGKRAAQIVVNVGFALNFVVLALVWSTIAAPAADPDGAGQFATVLGASTNIVLGSLLAYVISQNWDVLVFHRIREYTGSEKLWLRNIGSTASSQAIDTIVFVAVGFVLAPAVLDVGMDPLPFQAALGLMIGQYLLKFAIAVLDTPVVYAIVSLVRSREGAETGETHMA